VTAVVGKRAQESAAFAVVLTFHGDLAFFLKRQWAGGNEGQVRVERRLRERTSVKDVIESCGVPHTEVDAISIDRRLRDFSYVIDNNSAIDVYPVDFVTDKDFGRHLQSRRIKRFLADGHLGKLARHLRLLGIDVAMPKDADDRLLLDLMQRDDRALLTRDRRLLMHAIVQHGFYPRSQDPEEQTIEVLGRFDLLPSLAPFTRCSNCNGLLWDVEKGAVINDLEPLTRRYYEVFRRCQGCGRIYWRGSHFDKLSVRVERLRAKLGAGQN
jgi:uncharacterized protein with PIN domain